MGILNEVRNVRTLDGGFPVYRDARIHLRVLHPSAVHPSSLYVLRGQLEALQNLGARVLSLRGRQTVGDWIVAPPVVEWDDDYGCRIIVDGIHRFFLARILDVKVTCIYIEGALLPSIGTPVAWDRVRIVDAPPKDPIDRRILRPGIEDTSECLRKYYRDFAFLGSRGRRPSGVQVS